MKHLIPEFEKLRERFPEGFESSLVLPCVRRIQEDRGYVADSDIEELAAYLGVPQIQIEEVLSFYTQFRRSADRPLAPAVLPQRQLLDERRRAHPRARRAAARDSSPGQTTPDGRYTLSTAECLGSCGTAPMMMVNDGYHENLTCAKVDELLEGLK